MAMDGDRSRSRVEWTMKSSVSIRPGRLGAVLGLAVVLAGCAVAPAREAEVRAYVPTEARWAAGLWGAAIPGGMNETSDNPATAPTLGIDEAVRLAFGENPRAHWLRANFLAEIAAIDAAAAPGGLTLSWARLRPEAGLAKLALSLSVPLEEWLSLPARQRVAYWERAATAQEAAWETLRFEHEVRVAWSTAVAEGRRAARLAEAAEVAALAAELGARYHAAGNLARRELHALELASGQALGAAAAASVDADAARSELASLLGLPATDPRLRLPDDLPELPAPVQAEAIPPALEVENALRRRLDLLAARSRVTARQLEAERSRRWSRLPTVEAGAAREREPDGERLRGPEVAAGWSPAGLAEARGDSAASARARAEAEALRVRVANELPARSLALRRAADVARLYASELLPRQAARVQEAQQRQSYMLEGPFTLLEERRQVAELEAEAVRQRWVAWKAWHEWQLSSGGAP